LKTRQLWFTRPGEVEVRQIVLPELRAKEVLVRTLYSAISAGTEMLVYRGQLPAELSLDSTLSMHSQKPEYPMQYGYAAVGQIEQVGSELETTWIGKKVFAFQPHASHFICTLDELNVVPDLTEPLDAVFLANTETAVSLVLDSKPLLGEKVVILGQGIVGLLVTSILSRFPLGELYVLDRIQQRRNLANQFGVTSTGSPDSSTDVDELKSRLGKQEITNGADLIYELTGSPVALNLAIELCGYSGRIVVGSWYGTKTAELQLGGSFHRNRIQIISSQVSTIAPELRGRWDKPRRFTTAWRMIEKIRPQTMVSHIIPFASAADAYQLLNNTPDKTMQVVFDYNNQNVSKGD